MDALGTSATATNSHALSTPPYPGAEGAAKMAQIMSGLQEPPEWLAITRLLA